MKIKFDEFAIIQGSTVATFMDPETYQYYYTPLEDFGQILRSKAFTHSNGIFLVNESAVVISGSFNGFSRLVLATT